MERVGPYELVRELGRGGMGVVHEVRHPELPGRRLALKRLGAVLGTDLGTLQRFQREAELLARVRHPGVVQVHAVGHDAQGPWLVTDLVEGQPLDQVLARGPLAPEAAAALVAGLADAVAALHAAGVLHRDLKPENVLLDPAGQPVLLDFGLARELDRSSLTTTGELLGTPAYMAPEQVRDARAVDARADVYGLGAILYATLAGRPPFQGALLRVLEQVLGNGPAWPVSADGALDAVCRRAMARAPEDRYPDPLALRDALRARLQDLTGGRPGRRAALPASLALVASALALTALVTRARGPGAPGPGGDPAPPATRAVPAPVESRLPTPPAPGAVVLASQPVPDPRHAHDGRTWVAFVSSAGRGRGHALVSAGSAVGEGARLWSLDPESGALSEVGEALELPWVPTGLGADPRGGSVWIVGGGELVQIGTGTWEVTSTLPLLGLARELVIAARAPWGAVTVEVTGSAGPSLWQLGVWDLDAKLVRGALSLPGPTRTLAISAGGESVALAASLAPDEDEIGRGQLLVLDRQGAPRWPPRDLAHCPLALAFTPDGGELLVGDITGRIAVLDAATGQERGELLGARAGQQQLLVQSGAHRGAVVTLTPRADGAALFSTSGERGSPQQRGRAGPPELRAWDPRDRLELVSPVLLPDRATAADLSPDGRWLVLATRRGHLVVWDVAAR